MANQNTETRSTMVLSSLRRVFAAGVFAFALGPATAGAQTNEPQQQQQQPQQGQPKQPQQGDKEPKKVDEFAEAARALDGPAGNPECVWLGRRVVNLMWRDDLDTAFRHLDLYDRFQCPGGHIQATFRCVVRQGSLDPKAPETLGARVHQCWINPNLQPQSASAPQPAQPSQPSTGTNP